MAKRVYIVDGERSRVVAVARSSVHDTTATMGRVSGTLEVDIEAIGERDGATVAIAVELTTADAGDVLRTRKLRGDLDTRRYPEARFSLTRVVDVDLTAGDRNTGFEATGEGMLGWRGRELPISPQARGSIDDSQIVAHGTFSVDMRDFGVKPPKFWMLKVEPVVAVEVELIADAKA